MTGVMLKGHINTLQVASTSNEIEILFDNLKLG